MEIINNLIKDINQKVSQDTNNKYKGFLINY